MASYVKIKRSKHKPIIIICRSFLIICPNVTEFFKNVLKRQKKGTLKKEKLKDEHFEVALTRNCAECGSEEEMRWLALHPSRNRP